MPHALKILNVVPSSAGKPGIFIYRRTVRIFRSILRVLQDLLHGKTTRCKRVIVYQEIMSKSRNWKVMEPVDELPHVNAETLVIVSQI